MIMPLGARFSDSLRWGAEIFHHLKKIIHGQKQSTSVGDEGGFAPNYPSHEDALESIAQAVEAAGLVLGKDIVLALDVAATELLKEGKYILGKKTENKKFLDPQMWVNYLASLSQKYPIRSIEDGASEDDAATWRELGVRAVAPQIVGDDLLVTNPKRLKWAKEHSLCNSVLVKLNQIGSVSETLQTVKMAQDWNWGVVISHRSGETEDSFIADLAVGVGAGQIKTGSLSRSDRIAKYNQLLRIEEQLGPSARYYGDTLGSRLAS
jgi:enolase